MSDNIVYNSVDEVLVALSEGKLNKTQAAAWIEGLNARKVSFKLGVSSGNKVSVRCKGTNGQFGLNLYAVTLIEILKNSDAIRAFLVQNLDRLEIRPQDREAVETAITG